MAAGLLIGGAGLLAGAAAGISYMNRKRDKIRQQVTDPAQRRALLEMIGADRARRARCLVQRGGVLIPPFRYTESPVNGPLWVSAPMGTPIYAPVTSICIRASMEQGYGIMVDLGHLSAPDSSRYAHLSRVAVREGDVVLGGQLIGLVGASYTDGRGVGQPSPMMMQPSVRGGVPVPSPTLRFEVYNTPYPSSLSHVIRNSGGWLGAWDIILACEG